MGIVTKVITFLSVSLEGFSIVEFMLTKALDIGTGKLWDEIKKQLPVKSLEIQLYNVIEASIIAFSKLNDLNQIAPACEIIYGRWIQKGSLLEDDVKEALSYLNSRYIATRNVEVWYGLFYDEICKKDKDELYRWFLLKTEQKSDEDCRQRDKQLMQKINKILSIVASDNGIAMEEVRQNIRKHLLNRYINRFGGNNFV